MPVSILAEVRPNHSLEATGDAAWLANNVE